MPPWSIIFLEQSDPFFKRTDRYFSHVARFCPKCPQLSSLGSYYCSQSFGKRIWNKLFGRFSLILMFLTRYARVTFYSFYQQQPHHHPPPPTPIPIPTRYLGNFHTFISLSQRFLKYLKISTRLQCTVIKCASSLREVCRNMHQVNILSLTVYHHQCEYKCKGLFTLAIPWSLWLQIRRIIFLSNLKDL